jgi:maleate cis-trans isomerase
MSLHNNPTNLAKKLGIIAAPGWFDPTLGEFMKMNPKGLEVTQTILPHLGFNYSFKQLEESEKYLETAACLLAEAGSQVVGQVGPAFAYFAGGTPEGARLLQKEISNACGVPLILNGVAVMDAIKAMDCQRVAVACTYYDSQWKERFLTFLNRLGLSIENSGTFVEQGIISNQAEVDSRNYNFSKSEIRENIFKVLSSTPKAEAVVVAGAGVRFLGWIDSLEAELGIPIVTADVSLYWSVSKTLDISVDRSIVGYIADR